MATTTVPETMITMTMDPDTASALNDHRYDTGDACVIALAAMTITTNGGVAAGNGGDGCVDDDEDDHDDNDNHARN